MKINNNGNIVDLSVVVEFENSILNKKYIIYTDNTYDEDNKINLYASYYDLNDKNKKLRKITTEEEWKIIYNIIDEIKNFN